MECDSVTTDRSLEDQWKAPRARNQKSLSVQKLVEKNSIESQSVPFMSHFTAYVTLCHILLLSCLSFIFVSVYKTLPTNSQAFGTHLDFRTAAMRFGDPLI